MEGAHRSRLPWRLVALLSVCGSLAAACSSWPTFRQGPDRTGHNRFETQIGVGNVADLEEGWTAATGGDVASSPAVFGGVAYVGSNDGMLYAFDAAGVTGCSGQPAICTPLWTAATSGAVVSSPAVADGVVYVGSLDGKLYAFDADGVTGCSGTPKTCSSLWTASVGPLHSSPAVTNGVVYVGSIATGDLYAFDAAGVTGCAGTPRTCAPLWTGEAFCDDCSMASPAVSNGVVYVGSDEGLFFGPGRLCAFDAAGVTGCSGAPRTCAPLWSAVTNSVFYRAAPAVAEGIVYLSDLFAGTPGFGSGSVRAFDAAGVTGCSGTPKTCASLWTTTNIGITYSSPAVAKGVVYIGSIRDNLYAFDAAGVTGCSGTPKTCEPLWTAPTGGDVNSSPAVANGVVYVAANDGKLYAFDASGVAGCSGTPKTCVPLFSATTGPPTSTFSSSSPAVAYGKVFVGGTDDKLHAFELP